MQEPTTHTGPVRAFADAGYQPLCKDLAEVRSNIDRLDDRIVALIAERALYVKDAARFKRDAFQVSAPARQEEVFQKVRALAGAYNRGFEHLDDVVDAAYRPSPTVIPLVSRSRGPWSTTRFCSTNCLMTR